MNDSVKITDATEPKTHPYQIGSNYLIRTVTYFYTGKLVEIYGKELVISDAAWIADTGRFHTCLQKGASEMHEIEPYPAGNVFINRDCVVDVSEWKHPLPRQVK